MSSTLLETSSDELSRKLEENSALARALDLVDDTTYSSSSSSVGLSRSEKQEEEVEEGEEVDQREVAIPVLITINPALAMFDLILVISSSE